MIVRNSVLYLIIFDFHWNVLYPIPLNFSDLTAQTLFFFQDLLNSIYLFLYLLLHGIDECDLKVTLVSHSYHVVRKNSWLTSKKDFINPEANVFFENSIPNEIFYKIKHFNTANLFQMYFKTGNDFIFKYFTFLLVRLLKICCNSQSGQRKYKFWSVLKMILHYDN